MNHPKEEQFVLYYYGETGDWQQLEEHMRSCEWCRANYQLLQRVLNTVDSLPAPERPLDYESRVWERLRPKLTERGRFRGWALNLPPRWVLAPAVAALVLAAFLAGRYLHVRETPRPGTVPTAVQDVRRTRERVLLVAVGDHLERSEMILIELANADAGGANGRGRLDISYEQNIAQELVDSSRLYRQTAASTGDTATASLLEDLERALLEITHSPSKVTEKQLEDLRKRINEQGILFKVKVFGSRVGARERAPSPSRSVGTM